MFPFWIEVRLTSVVAGPSRPVSKPSGSKAASVLSLDDSEEDVKMKEKDIEWTLLQAFQACERCRKMGKDCEVDLEAVGRAKARSGTGSRAVGGTACAACRKAKSKCQFTGADRDVSEGSGKRKAEESDGDVDETPRKKKVKAGSPKKAPQRHFLTQPVYMPFEKALLSSLEKIELGIREQTYATMQIVSYLRAGPFDPTSMEWPESTQDPDYSPGLGGRELEEEDEGEEDEAVASGEGTEEGSSDDEDDSEDDSGGKGMEVDADAET